MGRRRTGFGTRLDFGTRKAATEMRPVRGTYPNQERDLGRYGSTAYPSVLETYNRDSDFKRWQAGAQIFFGAGKTWSEVEVYARAYFFSNTGQPLSYDSKEIVHLFPSPTSPEGAWHTAVRTRGSLIFPVPLSNEHITLNNSSPDPSQHTLSYRVGSFYSVEQINRLNFFVGDQMEDSAIGTSYPDSLLPAPTDAVALTLIGVNASAQSLTFDLSRPHRRVSRGGRTYWKRETYDPEAPLLWNTAGRRHLCSSHAFSCSCPDHLGSSVYSMSAGEQNNSSGDRFPMPSANRTPRRSDGTAIELSPWESQGAGQFRQWRTLSGRRDERRDCKHIHCLRWEAGVPWLEPNDYPSRVGVQQDSLEQGIDPDSSNLDILDFFRRQNLSWNRFALAIADTVGLILFPGGNPREFKRLSNLPILWTDHIEPDPALCRANDWWLHRGTQTLYLFSPQANRFLSTININGVETPVLQIVNPRAAGAPVLNVKEPPAGALTGSAVGLGEAFLGDFLPPVFLGGMATGAGASSLALQAIPLPIALHGTASGQASVILGLRATAPQFISGLATGASTASLLLRAIVPIRLRGTAAGQNTSSFSLQIVRRASGVATGVNSASLAPLQILGRYVATYYWGDDYAVDPEAALIGPATGANGSSLNLRILRLLNGTAAGQGDGVLDLTIISLLQGVAAGEGAGVLDLTIIHLLPGLAAGDGAATLSLSVVPSVLLYGTAAGDNTSSLALRIIRTIGGLATGDGQALGLPLSTPGRYVVTYYVADDYFVEPEAALLGVAGGANASTLGPISIQGRYVTPDYWVIDYAVTFQSP